MKAIQKFTPEYLEHCKTMSPKDIVAFLEDFRRIHGEREGAGKSQLISMKIRKPLLGAFKARCQLLGMPYQTQIKKLMVEWLE
jgi:predicted DNA binding CopG/RHH family protein